MGITYCKRCLNPSSRPNSFFDDEGICPVCRFEEAKRKQGVDWNARRAELAEITEWGRERSRGSYDCIVTVSGGKDSLCQALYARDDLGLKPLLVSFVHPPERLHERGAQNLANLIELGFDCISVSPDPRTYKKLMKESFFKYGILGKSSEMALYAIPIHVAIAYGIPLVFLGENPALTIGEKHGRLDGDASKMKHCNTLGGGDPKALLPEDVGPRDVIFYRYPPDKDMEHASLRIVYLGYYMEDWSGWNNARKAIAHGLVTRDDPPEKIGDLWGHSALDEDFRIVNQMVKYVKYGFGHVTDQVCDAINLGRMTRDEAIDLVRKYDGKCDPSYITRYCRYLGIDEAVFHEVVEGYRNPDIWKRDEGGEWALRSEIGVTAEAPLSPIGIAAETGGET